MPVFSDCLKAVGVCESSSMIPVAGSASLHAQQTFLRAIGEAADLCFQQGEQHRRRVVGRGMPVGGFASVADESRECPSLASSATVPRSKYTRQSNRFLLIVSISRSSA